MCCQGPCDRAGDRNAAAQQTLWITFSLRSGAKDPVVLIGFHFATCR
jgi:hypothetical protein